ncbi:hypothetical protein JCM16408A_08210 [Methylobacterium phyllosphaerae]
MAALGLQFPDEPPPLRRHQRAGAHGREAARDIDGGALGAPGVEFGNDLQDASARKGPDFRGKTRQGVCTFARPRSIGEDAQAPDRYLPNARYH